jgi:broad specificity phosphatase PhoE
MPNGSQARWHAMIVAMQGVTELWLVRHGETEWSRDGRHTSITDVPLLPEGEVAARSLAGRLGAHAFDLVLTSPRLRARRTAELAGNPDGVVEEDLAEWAYGTYEGLTTAEIRASVPDWTIWTHGGLDGESVRDVTARMDRVIARVRANGGRVLCFGHGHALRALAARWVGQPVSLGGSLALDTATISVLGHDREMPVIVHWNS